MGWSDPFIKCFYDEDLRMSFFVPDFKLLTSRFHITKKEDPSTPQITVLSASEQNSWETAKAPCRFIKHT